MATHTQVTDVLDRADVWSPAVLPVTMPVGVPAYLPDFRVLVTGWRYWPRECSYVIHDALYTVYQRFLRRHSHRKMVVVDGACPYGGVDVYAHEWANGGVLMPSVISERHEAPYVNGKIQGPARNSEMVRLGANLCLSFPGESFQQQRGGTYDCTMKAMRAGIPVWTFHWSEKYRTL